MTAETDLPQPNAPGPREVELKLELELESLNGLCEHPLFKDRMPAPRESQSVYYDTEKQALARAGISLRVRRTGDRFVQTMKSDAKSSVGFFDRSEVEAPVSSLCPELEEAGPEVPAVLRNAAREGLRAVFETNVRRQTFVFDWNGSRIELALDQGEVVAADRREMLAEVELELTDGPPEALFDLARSILPRAPLRLGVLTKAERGTRLASGRANRPSKAEPVQLTSDMTVGSAFRVIALACIRHYRLNEPLVLAGRDAEALHQSRVALRRLRSAFTLFKSVLGAPRAGRFRDHLRVLATTLGEARNLDVLLKRRGEELDVEAREGLRTARGEAYDRVAETLRSSEVQGLMIDLVEWLALHRFEGEGASDPILPFADRVLDRFWKRVKRDARQLLTADDERRHELRIAGKKLRYAAEFFTNLHNRDKLRSPRDRFIKALEQLQEALGDLNDLATEEQLQALFAGKGIEMPLPKKKETDQRARLLDRAEEAWLKLAKAGPYWR